MWLNKFKENQPAIRELLHNFDWNETQESVSQESRARVLILGLAEAGKSTLLNRLCGWTVSEAGLTHPTGIETGPEVIEDFGLFCLVTLPQDETPTGAINVYDLAPYGHIDGYPAETMSYGDGLGAAMAPEPLSLAELSDLLIYVIDGTVGVRAADYRWVGRLRRLGIPLLIVLNKCDLLEHDLAACQTEMERRLAAKVVPISALTGAHIWENLLPKMAKMCPGLTVALGRQLPRFRLHAVRRLISQAALLNGIVALEPIPLIDLPLQLMTITSLMLRIGAVYDRPPTDVRRREVVVGIAGGLAARYGAQQLVKLVPVIGWLISAVIGWSCTWLVGQTASAYFDRGGDDVVDRAWGQAKGSVSKVYRQAGVCWQRRPRLKVQWGNGKEQE